MLNTSRSSAAAQRPVENNSSVGRCPFECGGGVSDRDARFGGQLFQHRELRLGGVRQYQYSVIFH